jgi:FkbM family methyltransferase
MSIPSLPIRALLAIARHTPLGRGKLRRGLTKIVERCHQGPIDTTFRGVPIRINMDNTTERKALFGTYDIKELDFISAAVSNAESVFIDIGANSGLYTLYIAAHMGSGSQIIAIEPNSAMCERIEHNVDLSKEQRRSRNVQVFIEQCAVGSQEGQAFLDLKDGFGQAQLSQSHSIKSLRVPVRTLMDIAQAHKIKKVDALKIDIEGYEDRVLEPFFRVADRSLFPKAIVIEHTHRGRWATDAIALCEAIGYRRHGRTRGNLLLSLP